MDTESRTAPKSKPVIQVEARLNPLCSEDYDSVREEILSHLQRHLLVVTTFHEANVSSLETSPFQHVERLRIMEKSGPQDKNASQKPLRHMTTELGRLLNANPDQSKERSAFKMNGPVEFYLSLGAGEVDSYIGTDVDFSVHVYQLHDEGVVEHHSDEEKSVMLAHHWSLPCREFEGIWDSLIFDEDIKTQLLEYVQSALLFSDRGVSADLVSWSRVVLLYGPPGTGKTSLCKALAQRIAIRLFPRFRACRLVEINSHSLFSKWFSESGKMVQKMFQQIWEMAEDESTYVCVLIDEVESLAAARKAALAGGEPSDSIRAVNALLTQIDKLKQRKNVLILATSNMTEAIDVAFADRADIKMYIGLPSHRAIYWMLRSGITELQRVNIIDDKFKLISWLDLQWLKCDSTLTIHIPERGYSEQLYDHAKQAEGLSGRLVRRLPFLAHATKIQTANSELQSFLDAVKSVVEHEKRLSLGL